MREGPEGHSAPQRRYQARMGGPRGPGLGWEGLAVLGWVSTGSQHEVLISGHPCMTRTQTNIFLLHTLLFLHFLLIHLILLLFSLPFPCTALSLPTSPGLISNPFPCLRISPCVHLPCRMPQLSLTWQSLGPAVASLWLFLPLAGVSCLLAYILVQGYTAYETSQRLRCFPQPPKRNWLLGHLGLVSAAVRWAWAFRVEGIVRRLKWAQ